MAAGGVEVEEVLEPQQFPKIVKLWERYEKLYPREKQEKCDHSADPLLTLLDPVFKQAKAFAEKLKESKDSAKESKDSQPLEIARDKDNSLLFEDENAAELLQLSGWKRDKDTWCLQESELQLLLAANYFVEYKLGKTQQQGMPVQDAMAACVGSYEELPPPFVQEEAGALTLTDDQIDGWIRRLLDRSWNIDRLPSAKETKAICTRARQVLVTESNVLEVAAPATLVGDIHGQYWDLLHRVFGGASGKGMTLEDFKDRKFVFLGDFVDRGENSLLCLCLILLLKIKYPHNIFLLRGNHESRITNNMYGFHEECRTNYPAEAINHDDGEKSSVGLSFQENSIWYLFNHLFDAMPLAALVGGRVFCCHGGLSPQLDRLDEMLVFDRVRDIVPPGPMADITWSDPGMCEGWRINARGSGYLFGEDISEGFCKKNNLKFICRAHQCVREGYRWDHNRRVVTVFSAPNYCWQQNKGAILNLGEDMVARFEDYECTQPERHDEDEQKPSEYFSTEDEPASSSPKAAEAEGDE